MTTSKESIERAAKVLKKKQTEKTRAQAANQIRFGPDGAVAVPSWARLNAYWWISKGRSVTDELVSEGVERSTEWPTFLRELYARLFTGDRCHEVEAAPEFAFAKQLHSMLGELPEWKRLASRCQGDWYNSESVAIGMGSRVVDHVPVHGHDCRKLRRLLDMLDDDVPDGEPVPPVYTETQEALRRAEQEAIERAGEMSGADIRQALRGAIKDEQDRLDDIEKSTASLGWGSLESGSSASVSANTKAEVARKLQGSPKLQEILEMAGRMRNIMREVQSTKVRHGTEGVTDIMLGSDIHRLLPSELAGLRRRETKLALVRRLIEGGALQYRLESEEKVGRGPLLVVIDDSGSMRGAREIWSKAVALALLDLARREQRPFGYCLFTTVVRSSFTEDPGTKTPPGQLLEHLAYSRGGGTAFDPPLKWALEQLGKSQVMADADVIFISDGECLASEEMAKAVKKSEARFWGVGVAGAARRKGTGAMADFCDHVYPVQELVPDKENKEELEAARGVLAV